MTKEEFRQIYDIDELISIARSLELDCVDDLYSYDEASYRIGDYASNHIRSYGLADFQDAISVVCHEDSYYFLDRYCYFDRLTEDDFDEYFNMIYDEMEEYDMFTEDKEEDEEEESPELGEPDKFDSFVIKDLFGKCCDDIKTIDQHFEEKFDSFFAEYTCNFTEASKGVKYGDS